ncbi:unnamed protein product [Mycena citricolor]|uniref:Histone H4 n=1 Tax=Mycena citricolor TaxID=2018698 RepID=A0AAD2HNL8_9AGAR|nr:unnamed protein product [Mycena citricolor]
MLEKLPPEILSRVLEIAIETWGIGFLPPICLVSSTCYHVVNSSPSLWGILNVGKRSSMSVLSTQLVKAKESELRIYVASRGWQNRGADKHMKRFTARLAELSRNWVEISCPSSLLAVTKWSNMARLRTLTLSYNRGGGAREFFGADSPRNSILSSFTAVNLPQDWVQGFLGPSISYFAWGRFQAESPMLVQRYLALIPNVHTLGISDGSLQEVHDDMPVNSLDNLHHLEIAHVKHFSPILLYTRAPSLRVLAIRQSVGQMSLVFSHWSQPRFLPSHLQNLELFNCFERRDTPFLIQWLARLPKLLRLAISNEDADFSANPAARTSHNDLVTAMVDPNGAGDGWLCPSLIHLCLDYSLRVADLLPMVRARTSSNIASPAILRTGRVPRQNASVWAVASTWKGLGKGGAKRHRKILRDNIQGITKPAIRRLARRGGVKRISGLIYEETRGVLKIFLENVIRDSVTYTEHAKRKTVTALDVVYALKRSGRTLYGFGA